MADYGQNYVDYNEYNSPYGAGAGNQGAYSSLYPWFSAGVPSSWLPQQTAYNPSITGQGGFPNTPSEAMSPSTWGSYGGGMSSPISSYSMGGYGVGGLNSINEGMAKLSSNLMQMILAGQLQGALNKPTLEGQEQKYYSSYFEPNFAELEREGEAARQKYTGQMWAKGRGLSTMLPQKLEEARLKEAETRAYLERQARSAARTAALQDLQYQETSPTQLLGNVDQDYIIRLLQQMGFMR